MLEVMVEEIGKATRHLKVTRLPCRIGKGQEVEVALHGWRVGRLHAELRREGRGLKLVDLGTLSGTQVNGERVFEFGPLTEPDRIVIAGITLRVHGSGLRTSSGGDSMAIVGDASDSGFGQGAGSGAPPAPAEVSDDRPALGHPGSASASGPRATAAVGAGASKGDEGAAAASESSVASTGGPDAPRAAKTDVEDVRALQVLAVPWRRLVHRRLLEQIDLRRTNIGQYSAEQLREEVRHAVELIVRDLDGLPDSLDRAALVEDTLNEAVGYGPLEVLMADDLVSEIMVNGPSEIYVERRGKLERTNAVFTDEDAIRNVIERIVTPLGRRIDESSPLVDARLPDGSRVNAIIPPVALKGPTITIRRFNRVAMKPGDLARLGSASDAMLDFLRVCVQERRSIVVSGGTGSGKTTLLNLLSNLIPDDERLITIEDAAELKLHHDHLVSLEARPANAEGRGAVAIRDLVRNALRMRPDRIIVGECRGGEALDMLQAMNTGHEGSLTTVHANSPRDVISRLEVMCMMGGLELPLPAIRDQIASAVDLVVHQARMRDGTRKIVSIAEVTGVESGRIQMHELFRFAQHALEDGQVKGAHEPCDSVPVFYDDLKARGVMLDYSIFASGKDARSLPSGARALARAVGDEGVAA